jgi:hypothetical protein
LLAYTLPTTPTPPATRRAPVVVLTLVVLDVTLAVSVVIVLALVGAVLNHAFNVELYAYLIPLTIDICPFIGELGNAIFFF